MRWTSRWWEQSPWEVGLLPPLLLHVTRQHHQALWFILSNSFILQILTVLGAEDLASVLPDWRETQVYFHLNHHHEDYGPCPHRDTWCLYLMQVSWLCEGVLTTQLFLGGPGEEEDGEGVLLFDSVASGVLGGLRVRRGQQSKVWGKCPGRGNSRCHIPKLGKIWWLENKEVQCDGSRVCLAPQRMVQSSFFVREGEVFQLG